MRRSRTLAVLAAGVLLTACSGVPPGDARASDATAASQPTSAASPTSASPAPSRTLTGGGAVTEACGGPTGPKARLVSIKGEGATLSAFDVGTGSTVAVLLHQTGEQGFCGWWPYASWLTARERVRALAVNFCGYRRSTCPPAVQRDQLAQVRLAVDWARRHGARRVVLVGASMGGAIALEAAPRVAADAVVDLSGPAQWPGTDLRRSTPLQRKPVLVAVSEATDPSDYDALQPALARFPARHKRFVGVESGHGWSLLAVVEGGEMSMSPLATTVADWVLGHYS